MIAAAVSFGVPFCDLRSAIVRIGPIAVVLALSGCIAGGPGHTCDPSCDEADAGVAPPTMDGAIGDRDDAALPDAGGSPPTEQDSACWNGLDDNANGTVDCAESTCSATPFCCLGDASAACCAPSVEVLRVDFSTCAGTDPSACAAQSTSFGQPASVLESNAFVPNGGSVSDAGLVLGDPQDGMRERIVVSARLAASLDGCTDCLDAVGVGVGDALSGDVVSVHPDVAVLVRAARRDYALVIAGEVIASAPLPDGSPHRYELTLAPDGGVALAVDDIAIATARWTPRPDRRVVLYGRTHNRSATAAPPARALDVSVATSECEIPSALRRDATSMKLPPSLAPLEGRAPSVGTDGTSMLLALELDGHVHLVRPDGAGGWVLAGSGVLAMPALTAPEGEAYRDPELVRGIDRWMLYVTHEREVTRTIARAEGAAGFLEEFGAPVDLASPSGVEALSQPSVATWSTQALMAAVAEREGAKRIVLMELAGDALAWRGGSLERATVLEARGGIAAFDADEIAAPALFVDGANLLRLYYAGRRGTRWSIGMIASGDAASWPTRAVAPVLSASGDGYDALSVSDPSVARVGDSIALFYSAFDGVHHTIGHAAGDTRW